MNSQLMCACRHYFMFVGMADWLEEHKNSMLDKRNYLINNFTDAHMNIMYTRDELAHSCSRGAFN